MFKKIMKNVVFFSGALLFAGIASHLIGQKEVQAYQSNPVQSDSNAASHSETQWVYNEDNVAHEVGDVVVWVSTATLGTTGLSIATTTTAGDPKVAGVVVGRDIAATSWGTIQIRGYVATVNVTNTCVDGGPLITSLSGELAISTTTADINALQASGSVFGISLDASSGGSCPAILK